MYVPSIITRLALAITSAMLGTLLLALGQLTQVVQAATKSDISMSSFSSVAFDPHALYVLSVLMYVLAAIWLVALGVGLARR